MASNMYLYWCTGSVPCWKAMLVLEEKGFSGYPNKEISFSEEEHKGEEVMKLNPRGQIPAFKDGDVVINESGAICFYLENKSSNTGTKLLPEDSAKRATVLQRVFESDNIYSCFVKDIVLYHFLTPKDKLDQDLLQTRFKALRKELKIWDGYLSTKNEFLCGSDFTMADVFFFPYIAFGVRLGLHLAGFPSIKTYYERVKERPSVKASWNVGPYESTILGPV